VKNVLLVIHNRSELRRIAARFDQAGYGIATAADGLEGYDVFSDRRPDAVVSTF
jgi:DNA-binding response OmpR family regulator